MDIFKCSAPQESLLSPQESTEHTHTHRGCGGTYTVMKQEISIILTKTCPCLRKEDVS